MTIFPTTRSPKTLHWTFRSRLKEASIRECTGEVSIVNRGCVLLLRLRPGASLAIDMSTPTDEGFETRWLQIEVDGDQWRIAEGGESKDCDGRYSNYGEYTSPGGKPTRPSCCSPFTVAESGQRDFTAEAAGY